MNYTTLSMAQGKEQSKKYNEKSMARHSELAKRYNEKSINEAKKPNSIGKIPPIFK